MSEINYFGYGSNMDFSALKAKGVIPVASRKARLSGWKLSFSVEHFFRHEGGVGNIKKTGNAGDTVCGVLHACSPGDLAALDKLEGYGVGYDRIDVEVETEQGRETAKTYVGLPAYVNEACLPTRRYLNILVRGARAAGIDADYIEKVQDAVRMDSHSFDEHREQCDQFTAGRGSRCRFSEPWLVLACISTLDFNI